MPIDILEFFCLTPLPGSEDHKNLYLKGVPMDPDMNKYDLEHVCTAHPLMSAETWSEVYRDAWARYYTDAHVETVLRRAVASGLRPRKIADVMTAFSGAARIEGVHPLQCGIVRRKVADAAPARDADRQSARILSVCARSNFVSVVAKWLELGLRYTGIKKSRARRSSAEQPMSTRRLRLSNGEADQNDGFCRAFADKIPEYLRRAEASGCARFE